MAKIVVGMSGGVDSSVAALLLKRQGHDVTGVFMKNWEEKDERGVCTSEEDWSDVRHVCDIIGIPYYSVNYSREYWDKVFTHFLEEYKKNRTPNPDVLCNREIKFDTFLRFAESIGADHLATGHFANLGRAENGEMQLLRAKDENKDQTYFLYMLGQRALSKALFPVGNLTKAEIREIAREAGLPTSEKKDSTGVCFIGERNFREFLKQYLPAQPGEIRTREEKVVGRHEGLMYYTPGQRRGLGIGGGGNGERWFVVGKDVPRNVLYVSQGEPDELFTGSALADEPTWIAGHAPVDDGVEYACKVRLRHRQPLQDCVIVLEGDKIHMRFPVKQRAVTPGQAAVLYQGDVCLGGGTILSDRDE